MPSHLVTPVLPASPSPSPLASCSSQHRKGKKSSGLLRQIKRSVLSLVGREEDKLSLRKRKAKDERFPPQISVPPPPSSSHASAQSRSTPHMLQTPVSSRASSSRCHSKRRGTVLSVLGISLEVVVSSPAESSSVRSCINGSSMLSPAPSSCASRPTSVGSASTRTSATNLPRGRRNSHQYKRQSEERRLHGKGDRLQLPWLNSAEEDASSMDSFMADVAHAGESLDGSPRISVRRASPSVVPTVVASPDVEKAKVQPATSVSSRKTKSPSSLVSRHRPSPLLEIPEVSENILGCSFGSSMHSTEVADVLSAALKRINTTSS